MKTRIFKFLLLFVSTAVLTVGCNNDDDAAGPTCSDGIQNGTETGIDCGGTCATLVKKNLHVQMEFRTETKLVLIAVDPATIVQSLLI